MWYIPEFLRIFFRKQKGNKKETKYSTKNYQLYVNIF